jgi:hypothetical protein
MPTAEPLGAAKRHANVVPPVRPTLSPNQKRLIDGNNPGKSVNFPVILLSSTENFQWEVFLHNSITYLSKYLFTVL